MIGTINALTGGFCFAAGVLFVTSASVERSANPIEATKYFLKGVVCFMLAFYVAFALGPV